MNRNLKSTLILSLIGLTTITGCGRNNSSSSSVNEGTSLLTSSTSTTSTSVSSSTPSTSVETSFDSILDYDSYIDEYSEAGHLYIHYYREGASADDYKKYGLWLWPIGKEGALFASKDHASKKFNVNGNGWMENIGDQGMIDQAGVCMDIDLNSTSYISGKEGKPFSLQNLERIGYLVVLLDSMNGQSHWTSDGGGDGFIEDVSLNTRENGAIHVYLRSGSVKDPTYTYPDNVIPNPVVEDTTGLYRSNADITSSTTIYPSSSTSHKFSKEGKVGYQVFIPTFRDSDGDGFGDLQGVIDSLDYLESLSVDTLWLSPFLKCNSYHGYDTVDYYKIDERFGDERTLSKLIYEAHKRNIKILMDLVINHTSTSSIWFKKAQRGEKGKLRNGEEFSYRDLFHFKFKGDMTNANKLVENDEDWYSDGESQYYYFAKFSSDMPEFNYDAQVTRDIVLDVAQYWLGYGIDGYRLDAIKHIYMKNESKNAPTDQLIEDISTATTYDEQLEDFVTKTNDYSVNTTKNINFWKEFANRIKSVFPDCFLVGENFDGWDQRIAPYYQAIDSQFDFNEYYHNLEYLYANMGSAQLLSQENDKKLNTYFKNERADFINSTFTSNHDVSRAINHINSSKNAAGLEVDTTISGTELEYNKAKVHAAITILQPGVSFIYYGDELGMSSNTLENDKIHNNSLDRYYRQPFKWAEEDKVCNISFGEGYDTSYDTHNINLENNEIQASKDNSMLSCYKALTAIKGGDKFPSNGTYKAINMNNSNIYAAEIIAKDAEQSSYKIIVNTNDKSTCTYTLGANESIAYSYNVENSSIKPYGILVIERA